MGTCVALGARMSLPKLRESSARMLKVTEGRWPKNILIPRTAGKDIFTCRMAHELKIFPYGRNIADVVLAVMEKDRQDAAQKSRVVIRIGDPFHEAKKARGGGGAKSAAPGSSKLAPAATPAAPGPRKSLAGAKAAASGAGKPPSGEPAKGQRLPSPPRTDEAATRVADFDTNICMGDYLVGKFFLRLGLNQDHGAGSDVGQLVVVSTLVVATSPTAAVGAKGASQDPWSAFCASGTIPSATTAKDVAGSVSHQLRHASQQLKHVSRVGLR
jgi:hypothetical protein